MMTNTSALMTTRVGIITKYAADGVLQLRSGCASVLEPEGVGTVDPEVGAGVPVVDRPFSGTLRSRASTTTGCGTPETMPMLKTLSARIFEHPLPDRRAGRRYRAQRASGGSKSGELARRLENRGLARRAPWSRSTGPTAATGTVPERVGARSRGSCRGSAGRSRARSTPRSRSAPTRCGSGTPRAAGAW